MQDKIQTYYGPSEITNGNHKGMPHRDSSYLSTDERGHIQASSLGGSNGKENVAAQAKDVNHHGYLAMENGEKSALKEGNTIQSEKIAYATNQPGNRADVFIVNDTITNAAGQSQNVHLSFTNMTYAEQESMNETAMSQASDMLDASPNPEDSLRETMSHEEYASLMEETDAAIPNIGEMYYGEWISTESNGMESGIESAETEYGAETGMSDMDDGGMSTDDGGMSMD